MKRLTQCIVYNLYSYIPNPRSEAKKKKSSFRITSIIDPIKNDNSDDKEDSDSANEGVEGRSSPWLPGSLAPWPLIHATRLSK